MTYDDHADDTLVRSLLTRAADELEPPPGLVAAAAAQGRRRRTRSRAAWAGSTLACAALVLGTATTCLPHDRTTLVGPAAQTGPGATAAPPAGGLPSPTRTFPVVQPPSPWTDEDWPADHSPQERARVDHWRQLTAAALQDLLPPAVGRIRLVDGNPAVYEGVAGGRVFPVTFSVRPVSGTPAPVDCPAASKGGTCRLEQLPGGVRAAVTVVPTDSMDTTATSVRFDLGHSAVSIEIDPHDASHSSAPVTAAQLLAFARSPRVLALVQAADTDPVMPVQKSFNEGAQHG
ncbi:hypothetical protein [Peterkaempfera griseoplana]|uniref:hypothetical protein n=1 Tax=Peterkaempfera griseoplana TaxID=66896 RepID=UPI0006E25FCB|nr:hypothetical protein [Peterkaempfera griseoplana]